MKKSNNMVQAVGEWFLVVFVSSFIIGILLPKVHPETPGSPFRVIYFLYTNMGLTYWEFFGFILLGLIGWQSYKVVKAA